MNKVITINLNGNAYQLEEGGYEVLRAYLDQAATELKDDPDKAEIMSDLEQAIAEKCQGFLGPHKSVVTSAEIEQITKDMGPVKGVHTEGGSAEPSTSEGKTGESAKKSEPAVRRLYQIREGAMLSGVCNGLATFLGLDVTIVRIAFIALAVLTKGFFILAYVVLMFVIPYANTSEEFAAARGVPFTARELIDRAKAQSGWGAGKAWERRWRRQWRRHQRWAAAPPPPPWAGPPPLWNGRTPQAGHASQVLAGMMAPILGLFTAAMVVLLVMSLVSLTTSGVIFGWPLPPGVPIWVGILALVFLFNAVVWPLSAARRATWRQWGNPAYPLVAVWQGLFQFAFTVFFLWLLYRYVPEVREFVHALPEVWRQLVRSTS
jgi:phage shock protein PspC (stress-responsive transcriptional regulator)